MRAILGVAVLCCACGGTQKPEEQTLEGGEDQKITIVDYEQKTKALLETTNKLGELHGQLEEQRRRLDLICVDHPDHHVCQPQTAARDAKEAFCRDPEFTKHVDGVVASCHQGECKQLDDAAEISRGDYMLLTQRLPHSLITFGASATKLDNGDKASMQQFLETLGGERGYVIIVGRASKDGPWKLNIKLALQRAENTRKYLVETLGVDQSRVGYITYSDEKMFLTELDAARLTDKKLSVKQANRSALVFSYPCFEGKPSAEVTPGGL